jgi:hypothetical protein
MDKFEVLEDETGSVLNQDYGKNCRLTEENLNVTSYMRCQCHKDFFLRH